LNDEVVKSKLATAVHLSEIDPSKYAAIFYPGGHGPMFDLPDDKINIEIAAAVSISFRV
jgi:putative intracellular protease/amidase